MSGYISTWAFISAGFCIPAMFFGGNWFMALAETIGAAAALFAHWLGNHA